MRLDLLMVKRKLAQSRERAKNLILKEAVLVNKDLAIKASMEVSDEDTIEIVKPDFPWVSRAGLKLEHAIKLWDIKLKGKVCADFGACTGGFTDVMLSFGARKVYAIDVGHDQLAAKLLQDERVVNMENTHIKFLQKNLFENVDFIAADVSYISLEKILPKIAEIIQPKRDVVVLIKPQFEVGKYNTKKGIVKDASLQKHVINKISEFAQSLEFQILQIADSPILGSKGNKEFLMYLKSK